jgi:L-amino acid N-acyltransferase YncA
VFVTVPEQDGAPLAIARAAVDGQWVGLTAVEVAADARGRGLGRLVSAAAVRWGAEQGARHAYAQVDARNAAGLAMFASLGFTEHSRYHYRVTPC